MNPHDPKNCSVCVDVKQKRRADREMRDRLAERIRGADDWHRNLALHYLLGRAPDLLDEALTEAGVS